MSVRKIEVRVQTLLCGTAIEVEGFGAFEGNVCDGAWATGGETLWDLCNSGKDKKIKKFAFSTKNDCFT